jgi:hypothetical protein
MLSLLSTCAGGLVNLCASVVGFSDIGATFVEVDIQGLWKVLVKFCLIRM